MSEIKMFGIARDAVKCKEDVINKILGLNLFTKHGIGLSSKKYNQPLCSAYKVQIAENYGNIRRPTQASF